MGLMSLCLKIYVPFFVYCFLIHAYFVSALHFSDGQCVMSDQCEGLYGAAPCVYYGPPKPLDKNLIPGLNVTSLELLKELCPDFAQDENPHVCCSISQLVSFHEKMQLMINLGFSNCPSCYSNFRKLICHLSCSPWQNQYINITQSFEDEETDAVVEEINYFVSKEYVYILYDSCKDLQGLSPGTYLMDTVCGRWGRTKCSPEHWTEFMGSTPDEEGYSPFKTNYILTTDDVVHTEDGLTFYPMNDTAFRCSESPGPGHEACSCSNCKEACPADILQIPYLEPIAQPFKIFKMDGPSVVAFVIFAFIFIIASLMYCCCRKNEEPPLQTYETYGNCTIKSSSLGSLEDIQPLRNKSRPKIVSEAKRREMRNKPSRFQRAGVLLEDKIEENFIIWAHLVYRRPITVMFLSLSLCIFLSSGLLFNFDITTNPVDLWVSPRSQARQDMEYFNKHFGPFYRIQQVIVTPTNSTEFYFPVEINREVKNITWSPVFRKNFLLATLDLQLKIQNLAANFGDTEISLADICLSPLKPLNSECVVQSIFGFFQNNPSFFKKQSTYLKHFKSCTIAPQHLSCFAPFGGPIDSPAVVLGGFNDLNYESAQALVISIPVPNFYDSEKNIKARIWEEEFLKFMKNFSHPLLEVAFKAERSIQDEIERGSHSDILTVAISYILMFCYITVSLGEFHEFKTLLVESKFTLGFFGVLIVLVSVISSLGLFSFVGVPATLIIVEVIPFLVLAVGVDNIFILVQAYQREEKKKKSIP